MKCLKGRGAVSLPLCMALFPGGQSCCLPPELRTSWDVSPRWWQTGLLLLSKHRRKYGPRDAVIQGQGEGRRTDAERLWESVAQQSAQLGTGAPAFCPVFPAKGKFLGFCFPAVSLPRHFYATPEQQKARSISGCDGRSAWRWWGLWLSDALLKTSADSETGLSKATTPLPFPSAGRDIP